MSIKAKGRSSMEPLSQIKLTGLAIVISVLRDMSEYDLWKLVAEFKKSRRKLQYFALNGVPVYVIRKDALALASAFLQIKSHEGYVMRVMTGTRRYAC